MVNGLIFINTIVRKIIKMKKNIRLTIENDIHGIKEVLDSTELFPSELLGSMISEYLNNPESDEIWFTSLINEKIIGFGYCKPEELADGTYNLLAIAVKKEFQGMGEGKKMIKYIENLLVKREKRILIVETSSNSEYILTRRLYDQLGYTKEAIIRDFWGEGEDKVIYWKKLK